MTHRLKEIRKNLKLTQSKFAELLGGEPAGWYTQRVERLENFKTNLDDVVADEVARKLGLETWMIFINPEEITSDKHRKMIGLYEKLPPEVQKVVDGILEQSGKK